MINVGVIGLGFMGATHVAAYAAAARDGYPCRLVAVADPKPHRRAGRLGDVGGNLASGSDAAAFDPQQVRGYESYRDLLADPDVQLVSVCTPTASHVPVAKAALLAGKHVLLEKPVALENVERQSLLDVSGRVETFVMPAMCMRFWPAWKWLRDRQTSGEFGPLDALTLTRLSALPRWGRHYLSPDNTGGMLIDLHVHDTDFVTFLFGRPDAVTCLGSDDHTVTRYHFDTGGPSVVFAEGRWDSQPSFPFAMRYVANFRDATVLYDAGHESPLRLCRNGTTQAVRVSPLTGYDQQIRHLLDCIRDHHPPLVTLDDALVAHDVLDAEFASRRDGKTVSLA